MRAESNGGPRVPRPRSRRHESAAAAKLPLTVVDSTKDADAPGRGLAAPEPYDLVPVAGCPACRHDMGFPATVVMVTMASRRVWRRIFLGYDSASAYAERMQRRGHSTTLIVVKVTPHLHDWRGGA